MKTKKKVLIALLSAACLTASALAFTACGEKADNRNPDIVAVYNLYVASAQANGETPLTYDAWLESVKGPQGAQGPQGTQGAQGNPGENGLSAYEQYKLGLGDDVAALSEEQWLASLKGETGKGVQKAELNEDGTKLILTYTDGTKDEIDAPKEFHKHTYGEVSILIEPETGKAGLGYHVCSADGHIELVEVKDAYELTAKDASGNAVAGLKLNLLNGADKLESVTTDESGKATFENFGKRGKYQIVADSDDYTEVDFYYTDAETPAYEILVAKSAENGISEAGTYGVNVGWIEQSDWFGNSEWVADTIAVEFEGYEETSTKYTISVDPDVGDWRKAEDYSDGVEYGSEYVFYLKAGESKSIYFSFSNENYIMEYEKFAVEDFGCIVKPYGLGYIFTVEKEVGPADGSIVEFALEMENGDNNDTIKTDDGSAWYVINGYDLEASELLFTFGDGVSIKYYGSNLDDIANGYVTDDDATPVTSGTPVTITEYGNNYFVVITTAQDGTVSFKAEPCYNPGHKYNPIELTYNTVTTKACETFGTSLYFKFTATEDKEIIVEEKNGSFCYCVGESDYEYAIYPVSVGGRFAITVQQGTVYYFAGAPEDGDNTLTVAILLRDYNEESDKGFMETHPIELTLTNGAIEQSYTDASNILYFKVSGLPDSEGALSVKLFGANGEELPESNYSVTMGLASDGDSVTFRIWIRDSYDEDGYKFDGSFTLKAEFVEAEETETPEE